MSVDPGMPARPATARRPSRRVVAGPVPVGGGAPVSVQSMTTTSTADVGATLRQTAELSAAGCRIVRVAVSSQDDADALPEIARRPRIPVIADVHFQPRHVFAAIEAGCAAVRVDPGDIRRSDDRVKDIARAAAYAGVPARTGVNAGSLDERLLRRHGRATPAALVESALRERSLCEGHGFTGLKISVKHHDPVVAVEAYRRPAAECGHPLRPGGTEAGPLLPRIVDTPIEEALRPAEDPGGAARTPEGAGAGGPGGPGRPAPRAAAPAVPQEAGR
ncbi:(E)-4-hydroxy-3-methylbut-2-enyl-diphosphate synthase [Streptomyces aidingensis]|uniref:(E)-4-hydroxy-3-methylbut-2-enyl-diphosphate synthase n=1 Tax=Streptomyces aidingensis TaxID=910347 RepID=A0A1I1S444_9ACTN|nr:(E)-4-hydroxy-3-methylbut-2-enyl-diphosphate synthase [Streptomyces aidingensis]